MTPALRVALKVLLMGLLISVLILFGQVTHDFVYRAF